MLRISQKITLFFAILMVISGAAVLYSKKEYTNIRTLAYDQIEKESKYQSFYADMQTTLTHYNADLEVMMSTLEKEARDEKFEHVSILQEKLLLLAKTLYDSSPEKYEEQYIKLIQYMESMRSKSVNLYNLTNRFAQTQAFDLFKNDIKPLQDKIKKVIADVSASSKQDFINEKAQIDKVIENASTVIYASLILLLVSYTLVGIWLWNGTIMPITGLTSYLKDEVIERSAFNVPFLKRKDEIGEFSRSFAELMIERDSAESSLRGKIEEVEAATKAKSEFLANMSHELRTPLNSILGSVQLLESSSLSKELKDMFGIIKTSSTNLLKIVNDILDLSKIEAGETELEHIAFDIKEEIKETVHGLRPIASKKGLTTILENNIDHDLFVLGDPLRFSRIIINLVNNAISYTESGKIKIEVNAEKLSDQWSEVYVKIIDTGIGIPEDRVGKIFEKFTQADTSTTRKYGGTGLGLTITSELIELMKGQIGVESVEKVGSTFWFKIPFETVEKIEKSEETEKKTYQEKREYSKDRVPLKDAKILMAEDQPMNVIFMKKLFKNLGFKNYKVAENGQEALEAIQMEDYTLVLMDCHMPVMNGYEATENIRNLEDGNKKDTPIMAMTANVMQKDIDACFEVGMDEYIGKPFDIEEFKEKVSIWIDLSELNEEKEDDLENAEKEPADTPEDQPIVNLDNLRDNAMGDEEFVKEMIAMFVTQGASQLQELEAQCTDGENDEWVEVSHALKGAAGGVGAMPMRDVCATAQDTANASAEERTALLSAIQIHYAQAKEYFIKEGLYEA